MNIQILLCSGTSSMSRKIIWFNKLTGIKGEAAQISHVAMKVYFEEYEARKLYLPKEGWYVIESTSLNKWAGKSGFQINSYGIWRHYYQGRIWSRGLELNICYSHPATEEFCTNHRGKDYESGIPGFWELLLCGLRLHKLPSLNQLHCSEVDILFLQKHNLFSKILLANNFPPHTFWENGIMEAYLRNCEIGDCEVVK